MKPFRRLPFATLPERPRRPHPYFSSTAHDLRMESAAFGPMTAHYREFGAGPPLLLIHGLMTSSYSWRYSLEELGRSFRLIAPDLPGSGRSDKPDRPYTAAALAGWIGEFQAALGLRGCAAVGNSLGGYLCMRRAIDDPGAFSRLVNIHSPAFPLFRLWALRSALALPGTRALLAWWIARAPLKWAHANVHYYDETLKSLEEAHEYGDPLATVDGRAAFIRYLAEAMSPAALRTFVGELAARPFPVPLLLLYSKQDPLVPPIVGERLHRLVPAAQMLWLDQTSHFAHVDSPERVVPPIVDFCR